MMVLHDTREEHIMAKNLDRRSFVALLGASLMAGCSSQQDQAGGSDGGSSGGSDSGHPTSIEAHGIDYLVLVNKQHELPEGWEDAVDIVHFKNTEDWDVDVEANAYDAYLVLKEDLEAEDGVYVDLDSAYRSVAAQQEIVDDFTEKYGEEYVRQYVAVPGFSEHHTGLALDLFLIIDGVGVYYNEDMVQYPEIWEKIHARLADHAFILRYLPQRKIYTGYSYEPWHIRYVYDPSVAHEIMDADITLEEYLGEVDPMVDGCVVDYGTSELYTEPDMDSALDAILADFHNWKGCVLKRFAYAGDDACGADELAYLNELREANTPDEPEYDQAIVFVTDYHSPSEEDAQGTAWEPDTDYTDWTWHLGRTGSDGSWKVLTNGYG